MFNCITCGKVFTVKSSLNTHSKTHDGIEFSCGICLINFTRRDNLVRHVREKHGLVGYGNDFNRAVVKKIALVTPLNTLVSDHTLKQSAAGDSNIISVMSVPSTSTADNTSSSLSPPPVHGTDISISNTNATAAITTSYPIANKRSIVSRKRYNDNSVRNVKKKEKPYDLMCIQ
ncbi:early growth response protein 1-like [Sipha flava]|uniref:Early growth response protein 1-like n=1 Tax=Sipha flava TaxID=143950 RepID=A0A8B8F999_9HEMI|nr:early growth response protein 1-like [Sipha flava]